MIKDRFKVYLCQYQDIKHIVEGKHYLRRKPQVKACFCLFDTTEGRIVGGLVIGKPASNSLCVGVCGEDFSGYVYELNRLYVEDIGINYLESYFIGNSLRLLRGVYNNMILVSYADEDMRHVGMVYQASSWLYTGKTPRRTDKFVPDGKHSRHYDKKQMDGKRVVRSAKYRYVKFIGNKSFRRKCNEALRYDVLPYEKKDLGYYDDQFIYKREVIGGKK